MAHLWIYFVSCVLLLGSTASGQTTCSLDRLDPAELTETDPPGTELLTLNVSDTIKYEYELGDNFVLVDYFRSTTDDTTFVLSLNKTLDLEAIYKLFNIKLSAVTLKIFCTRNGIREGGSAQLFVIVKNINEFDPEFINAPFVIDVPENIPKDTSLFKLRDHARDQDVNPSQEEISGFEILPYFAPEFDGRAHFTMDDVQNGVIIVSVPPDYEAIPRDSKDFILSLQVNDYEGKTGVTTMTINILDEDDQPPEFYEPGCHFDCYVLYEASIDVNFTGLLEDVDPYKIQARDRDTLNYTVAYSIKGTKPTGYDSYFHQNPTTGEISVIKPFSDTDDSLVVITLFLEAQQTEGRPSVAQTSFKLNVDRLLPPTTDEPEEKIAAAGPDTTLMIVLIVLAVVVFLLAGSFLLAVFCIKKKMRKPVYPDDSTSPSEKETDVEELSVDGQEQWPAPAGALADLPTGRGQTLPPLKDMGTGTEEEKKTRRSRRRKKEKDNHEFDGTKDYESSAEPEFFEQKKTRVKRSSRSKQLTDPKYWITVDNDY